MSDKSQSKLVICAHTQRDNLNAVHTANEMVSDLIAVLLVNPRGPDDESFEPRPRPEGTLAALMYDTNEVARALRELHDNLERLQNLL